MVTVKNKGYSPWGRIQQVEKIARGVCFVHTSSHGGIRLSPMRQEEMPQSLRIQGGWYEEDCAYNLVVVGLPHLFSKEQVQEAIKGVKNWFPEKYESFSGLDIPLKESSSKRRMKFEKDNENKFVVVAAWGDWHDAVPQGMIGVLAEKSKTKESKYFLVPRDEYHVGFFVVDPNKHKEVAPIH